ncbi:putative small protein [Leptolyngbya sp. PCC 7375]|nr:putative small protein [Leptolyngbya sp. PCC 7375]
MNLLQDLRVSGLPVLEQSTLDLEIAELESLRIRTELMLVLRLYIQERHWTLDEAAQAFRQSSPRMQNLINGEISRFSVEDLIQLLTRAGLTVQMSVQT